MLASDIEIGLRVFVQPDMRPALVVGRPEYYTPRAKLVRIKYENSTRFDRKLSTQLTAMDTADQYPALGGTYIKPEGSF